MDLVITNATMQNVHGSLNNDAADSNYLMMKDCMAEESEIMFVANSVLHGMRDPLEGDKITTCYH